MATSPGPGGEASFDEISERIAVGLTGARVRIRTLLELLEEKGVLTPGEFDTRAQQLWDRDYDELAQELMAPAPEEEEAPVPQVAESGAAPQVDPVLYMNALLGNFVAESVSSRIRMRALLDLLESKGLLRPNEFEERADQVWDRDYEELVLEFYRRSY